MGFLWKSNQLPTTRGRMDHPIVSAMSNCCDYYFLTALGKVELTSHTPVSPPPHPILYCLTSLVSFIIALFITNCWFLSWAYPPERIVLHLPTPPKPDPFIPYPSLPWALPVPRPSGFLLLSAIGRHQQKRRGKEEKEDWAFLPDSLSALGLYLWPVPGSLPPQWHL